MKKFIMVLIIVILGIALYQILSTPKEVFAPTSEETIATSTFQGPPPGSPSGIKGPSEPPPE